MVSFKVLAVVLLVAFVTVDAKVCPDRIKQRYRARLEQAEEGFQKLKQVADGQASYDTICADFEQLPRAVNLFIRQGKKADCEDAPAVTVEENQQEDEEEVNGTAEEEVDGTAVPKACKGMEKKLKPLVCGFNKFANKVDELKEKLEDAASQSSCKELNFRSVGTGLFLLGHLEKNGAQLRRVRQKEREERKAARKAQRACPARRKDMYRGILEKAAEGFQMLKEVADGEVTYDALCGDFEKLPFAVKMFIWQGKKAECEDAPTITVEENQQEDEEEVNGTAEEEVDGTAEEEVNGTAGEEVDGTTGEEVDGTDPDGTVVPQVCEGMEKKLKLLVCGFNKFASKVEEFNEKLEDAAAENYSCKELNFRSVAKGLFVLGHMEQSKRAELKKIRGKEKEAKEAAKSARKEENEKRKEAEEAAKVAEAAEDELEKLEKREERLQK